MKKTCKFCQSEINKDAKRCPKCQGDLRGGFEKHPILTVLGILFITPFIIAGFIMSSAMNGIKQYGNSGTPAPATQKTFVADVHFTGTQFIITNLDPHTCENAKMQVNGSYSLNGYNLESGLSSAAKSGKVQTYTVGASQFTKGDGSRFNPFGMKPLNFNIECRGDNELKYAFWYGEFK